MYSRQIQIQSIVHLYERISMRVHYIPNGSEKKAYDFELAFTKTLLLFVSSSSCSSGSCSSKCMEAVCIVHSCNSFDFDREEK